MAKFLVAYNKNFNSHAHVERDQKVRCEIPDAVISTHTLTWSVTSMLNSISHVSKISTHTLTWSVTR